MQQQKDRVISQQSLTDHLAELRIRLIWILFIIFVGSCVSYLFSEHLFDIIRRPIAPYLSQGGLVFTGIMDKFMAHLKLAVVAGIILTLPIWLYQVWLFVSPGLYRKERKRIAGFIFIATALFLTGASFCYFVVYPLAFKWLMGFGGDVDKPMITISEYLQFFSLTLLMFGAAFELPLVLIFLGWLGLIDQKFLREKRGYAYILLVILSGFMVPPDFMSQGLMISPLIIMYEASIFFVGRVVDKRAHQRAATAV